MNKIVVMSQLTIAIVFIIANAVVITSSARINKHQQVKPFVHILWRELDHYTPGQRYMCNFVCHKRQICLVHKNGEDFTCVSRHDLRHARRLLKKSLKNKMRPPHESLLQRSDNHSQSQGVVAPTHPKPDTAEMSSSQIMNQSKLESLIHDNTVKIGRDQKAEIEQESKVIQTATRRYHADQHEERQPQQPVHGEGVSCTKQRYNSLRLQLSDWFGMLHKTKELNQTLKKHTHKCDCTEVDIWMFHRLDTDSNLALTHHELAALEHNDHEKCLPSLLRSCDHDSDDRLTRKEWCCCFSHISPPCLESKQRGSPDGRSVTGAYVPQCDENGYYQKQQCLAGGECWCVDLNGNEVPHTRHTSPANCDGLNALGRKIPTGKQG